MFLQIEEEGIQICCAVNTIHKHKKTMTLSDFFVTGKTHNKHEKHIKGNTNCYRCGKPGHGRSQCKETKYRLKQGRRDFSLHRNVSVDQAIDILKEYDIEHRINRTKKKDMAKSNSKKMKFQLNTKEFDALPGTKKNPAASGRKFLCIMSFVHIYMVFLTFSFSFSFVHVFFLSFFLVFYFFHSFERMGQRSNKDSADDGRTADDERHSIFNY